MPQRVAESGLTPTPAVFGFTTSRSPTTAQHLQAALAILTVISPPMAQQDTDLGVGGPSRRRASVPSGSWPLTSFAASTACGSGRGMAGATGMTGSPAPASANEVAAHVVAAGLAAGHRATHDADLRAACSFSGCLQ